MADEKTETRPTPPYLPYRTLKGYIEGLKASGLPGKIDRTILRNRSGTGQTLLLKALEYLGMITGDGTPTQVLQHIVTCTDNAERELFLRDVLMARYPFLFNEGFSLQNATPSLIQPAFEKATGISGDTTRKVVAFFLAAAQDAQLPISSYLKVRPGRPAGGQRRRMRAGQPNGIDSTVPSVITPPSGALHLSPGPPKSHYQMLIDILDPSMEKEEQE